MKSKYTHPRVSETPTDFAFRYIHAHQSKLDNILWNYLALDNHGVASHTSMPTLQHTGQVMEKLSYANLDLGFWIEWECLGSFKGGPRRLTLPSLSLARDAYALAENHRQRFGSPASPQLTASAPCNIPQGQRQWSGSNGSSSTGRHSPVLAPAMPHNHYRQQQYHNSQYQQPRQQPMRTPLAPAFVPRAAQQCLSRKPFNPAAASWRPVAQQAS